MSNIDQEHKFIVRADLFGIIPSNQKTQFWLPKARGSLYFDKDEMHFTVKDDKVDALVIDFRKIIKVKIESLNPRKNRWCMTYLSSPYFLLFWLPFWNRYMLNITYLSEEGQPIELFFKLKTKQIAKDTYLLLKKSLLYNKKT